MDKIKSYWKLAKDNPKITMGIIIGIVVIITLVK
tara:strand:- start:418 stop:519 length:102 start_codon:yes stop_codon:yes gene_type:complete